MFKNKIMTAALAAMMTFPITAINVNAKSANKTVFKSNKQNIKKNKYLKITNDNVKALKMFYDENIVDTNGNITISKYIKGLSIKEILNTGKYNISKVSVSNPKIVKVSNGRYLVITPKKTGKTVVTVSNSIGEKFYLNINVKKINYKYEFMNYDGKIKKLNGKLKKMPSGYGLYDNTYVYGKNAINRKTYIFRKIYMPGFYTLGKNDKALKKSIKIRNNIYQSTGVNKLKGSYNCPEYKAYLLYKWVQNNTITYLKSDYNNNFSLIFYNNIYHHNGKYLVDKGDRAILFKFLCDGLKIKCEIRPAVTEIMQLLSKPVYASVKINGKWYIVDPDNKKFMVSNINENGKYKKGNAYNDRNVKEIFTSKKYDSLSPEFVSKNGDHEVTGWESGLWKDNSTTNRIPSKYVSKIANDADDDSYVDLYFKNDNNTKEAIKFYLFDGKDDFERESSSKTLQIDGGNGEKYSYNSKDNIHNNVLYDDNDILAENDYCYVKVKKI